MYQNEVFVPNDQHTSVYGHPISSDNQLDNNLWFFDIVRHKHKIHASDTRGRIFINPFMNGSDHNVSESSKQIAVLFQ